MRAGCTEEATLRVLIDQMLARSQLRLELLDETASR